MVGASACTLLQACQMVPVWYESGQYVLGLANMQDRRQDAFHKPLQYLIPRVLIPKLIVSACARPPCSLQSLTLCFDGVCFVAVR
jgi:hypothetical protein